jgi:hypothetical protein
MQVRLHMLHNHKEKDAHPIDNLTIDMQSQWDSLMLQCFPGTVKEVFADDANGTAKSPEHAVSMVHCEQPLLTATALPQTHAVTPTKASAKQTTAIGTAHVYYSCSIRLQAHRTRRSIDTRALIAASSSTPTHSKNM